ncbi:hypothetical protein Hamer_G022249, partial [Homarus americanus]
QFLELPESPGRRHSSSEDDRRAATLDCDPRTRPHDKEKKGHRSAWGKVKNMISTRRDSVRKKSTPASHRKSTIERPLGHDVHAGTAVEVSAASDPEDYEVDYEGVAGDVVVEAGSEGEWEAGGVWTGPREEGDSPVTATTSLGVRRAKPQLTITVPSSVGGGGSGGVSGGDRPRQLHRSPESRHRKVSPAQLDPRAPPSLPMTPPSPRRASNWTKVKKAFLTGQQHQPAKPDARPSSVGVSASLPPSPSKKTNTFHFDSPPHLGVESSTLYDSDSPVVSLEVSPEDLVSHAHSTPTPSPQPHSTPSPQPLATHQQHSGVLADLQKSLSGEFNRRLQEWEKLKGGAGQGGIHHPPIAPGCASVPPGGVTTTHPEDNLPYEFRKKLHEWEKMKEREREKGKTEVPRGQEDVKTKIHGEDDLPADFRKKLTEWKIRKALVGQSQHNVEELQKNLGEEFNRKMAEWERIKASANQGHIKPSPGHPQVKPSASAGNIQVRASGQIQHNSGSVSSPSQVKASVSASQVLVKPITGGPSSSPRLDRKGSAHKIKKMKSGKTDKAPVGKTESSHKGRDKSDKELQWLEKELHKVERETQRLEREKEKFLERQARLEKMRQAMGQGGPAKKKEIYIKTSTGEFRFEGISQTFTKKLYEWEERRGIRPESSTIALLDPNYKAPEKEVQEKPKSPEPARLVRSKSESSMAAEFAATSVHSHPSSLSLNEMETEDTGLQENKAASEPTLAAEDPITPKVAVLVQLEEVVDDTPSLHDHTTPYAPAEITRNIDSSGSEEDVTRRRRADDNEDMVTNLRRTDSGRTQGSYRSLLHENMSLLDKLRQQEDLCRALETQMGDIDSKMDNVADQHLRTLEKLHRQVTIIMKDSSSTPRDDDEDDENPNTAADDTEANQRLINQLKARIVELEMRGDHLMDEKEQLERAFKLHKEHETEIAESLVQRIRELQDAGAEVNIQTVQCQNHDLNEPKEDTEKDSPEGLEKEEAPKEELKIVEKEEEDEEEEEEEQVVVVERRESRPREHRKVKKVPPKKVQKLHNLTGDLLFQAKRLEQALVAKHGLERRGDVRGGGGGGGSHAASYRQRSLRGRSSLRLVGDLASPQRRGKVTPGRTWSSIEAITIPGDAFHGGSSWEGGTGGGQEARESVTLESSRSFKGHSSQYTCDPQDLLAMNAELSRMAKELRVEMMKMWSFRGEQNELVAEANGTFQSRALLHKMGHLHPMLVGSTLRSLKSPSTTSLSKRRESVEWRRSSRHSSPRVDDDDDSISLAGTWKTATTTSTRSAEHMLSSSFEWEEEEPEERKKPKGRWKVVVEEEEEVEEQKKPRGRWKAVVDGEEEEAEKEEQKKIKGRWQAVTEEEKEEGREEQKKVKGRWQAVTEEGKEEGREEQKKVKGRWQAVTEEEKEGGREEQTKVKGRWQAVTEEEKEGGREEQKKVKGRWQAVTEEEKEGGREEQKKVKGRWQAVTEEEKEEGREEQKKVKGRWRVVTEDEEEEGKDEQKTVKGRWQAGAEEESEEQKKPKRRWKAVVAEEEGEDRKTPKPELSSQAAKDGSKSFETEVTVEYESFGQNNRDECFAYTFSRTVYDDEALTAGRLSRNTSMRKANSRDADDGPWRRLRALPSVATDDPSNLDKSPDVFVPTKRTIFTVLGGNRNPEQARATPTFVDSQDDEQEIGMGPWRRSQSQPSALAETKSTPVTPLLKRKDDSTDTSGHRGRVNVSKTVKRETERAKSENGALARTSQNQTVDTKENVKVKLQNDSLNKEPPRVTVDVELNVEAVVSSLEKETVESNAVVNKETPIQDDVPQVQTRVEEASDAVVSLPSDRSPRSPHQPTPSSLSSSTASLLQMPTPTSPPIESKRKVLEAVNEGVPAVRNIIQKFNQRITENQELLGSPFRSPPSSPPPWQSPRTQRKILAGLMVGHNKDGSNTSQSNFLAVLPDSSHSLTVNPAGGVLKSLSASVIASDPEPPQPVQRSASGSLVQGSKSNTSHVDINIPTGQFSIFKGPSTSDGWSSSPAVSPAITPAPTDPDTSCDMDVLVDDPGQHTHDRTSGRPESRSPAAHLRALKIKKAKEEFLARGAAPLTTEQRLSGCHDPLKLRHRSGTASTEDSWRESDEIYARGPSPLPSPTPTESSQDREEPRDKPPRVASRRRNIPKKESFRRQSAGCLLEESASQKLSSQVVKSASSGVLGSDKRHSRYSIDSQSPDRRKTSIDPSVESTRSSLGIFKLFRRNKNRDKKDMPSVQRLCRQSLLVDFANGKGRTQSASPQPRPDSHLRALPEVEGEDSPDAARSSKTLPRGGPGEAAPPAPSRSCPSSPVAPHRSRTANWLARGRQIFKSRSPSPGKKPR